MPDPPRTFLDALIQWQKRHGQVSARDSVEIMEGLAQLVPTNSEALVILANCMTKFSDAIDCKQFLLRLAGEARKMEE